MKENALQATTGKNGGARLTLEYIKDLAENYKETFEIHIAGHSAGSIFHAPLIRLLTTPGKITEGYLKGLTGLGLKISSCTLWAPVCTVDLFKMAYLPSILNNVIERFALFVLTDRAENDDHCAHIYHKSLLYLVSDAFEERFRIPVFRNEGEPILGMQKFVNKDEDLSQLFSDGKADLILSPNSRENDPRNYSTSTAHGDFDDDKPTIKATLARILNNNNSGENFVFSSSASSLKDRRAQLTAVAK